MNMWIAAIHEQRILYHNVITTQKMSWLVLALNSFQAMLRVFRMFEPQLSVRILESTTYWYAHTYSEEEPSWRSVVSVASTPQLQVTRRRIGVFKQYA